MRNIYISIFCSFIVLLTACSKDDVRVPLPDGSVSVLRIDDKDSLEMPLSILQDTTFIVKLQAALSGEAAVSDHWVSFAVDTTKMAAYRVKYGEAMLLPAPNYLLYKPVTKIAAGAAVSDSAIINIGLQTKLIEYSTYVLPVVVQSVDGNPDVGDASRVLYLVFKTGKPLAINKTGWAIESYSSHFSNFKPEGLLDNNNLTSYWATDITKSMPQWVIINFNRNIIFAAVNYYLPNNLGYPNLGGYPTSMRIETSMNGTDWDDKGVFSDNVTNLMQSIDIGLTTARYLRFTVLASVRYANLYDAVFISGISLVP